MLAAGGSRWYVVAVLGGFLVSLGLIGCGGDEKTDPVAPDKKTETADAKTDKEQPSVDPVKEKSGVATEKSTDSAETKAEETEGPRLVSEPPSEPIEMGPAEPYVAGGTPETERSGEDWPWFLGLKGTSVSSETGLLEKWPEAGPPVLWKMRIGSGYAAPAILGNRLVLFHRQGDEEVTECYTADTGEWLWRETFPTDFVDPYGYSNGPRCSPVLTKENVYTFGSNGRLTCHKLETGEVLWMRETNEEFDVPDAFFGVGSTPMIYEGLLIVMVGGQPNSGMVAFNARTGETVWENVGKDAWPNQGRRGGRQQKLASYSSPMITEIHGKRHLLAFMRPGLVSLDPGTGEINFSYFFRSRLNDSVNAAMPVVVDDQIFLSAAYQVGAVLLRVAADGKSVEEVWKDEEVMMTHWTTAIHHEGFLYGFSGRNEVPSQMRCIELATGKLRWQTKDDESGAFASPKDGSSSVEPKWYGRGSAVMAEGKFLVLGERGTLALVPVNPDKFEEISRVKYPGMKYPSWTGPILSRGRLYIRCEDKNPRRREYYLYCLDLAASAGK